MDDKPLWTNNDIGRFVKSNMLAWEDKFAAGYWTGVKVRNDLNAAHQQEVDALLVELALHKEALSLVSKESEALRGHIGDQQIKIAATQAESNARKLLADINGRRMVKAGTAARALYAALHEREHCEQCGHTGRAWTEMLGDASLEPCQCSVKAQEVLAEYSEWAKESEGQHAVD